MPGQTWPCFAPEPPAPRLPRAPSLAALGALVLTQEQEGEQQLHAQQRVQPGDRRAKHVTAGRAQTRRGRGSLAPNPFANLRESRAGRLHPGGRPPPAPTSAPRAGWAQARLGQESKSLEQAGGQPIGAGPGALRPPALPAPPHWAHSQQCLVDPPTQAPAKPPALQLPAPGLAPQGMAWLWLLFPCPCPEARAQYSHAARSQAGQDGAGRC